MLVLKGKTLVFGDLHIGVKNDSPSRLNITIKVIEEILKKVNQQKIDNIIFLGDFFESRIYLHSATLTIAYKLVSLLAKNCNVILIAGNHDMESNAYRDVSPVNMFSDITNVTTIFDIQEFSLNNKTCLAVPWGYKEYQTNKKYDYIFGHLSVSSQYIKYNKVVGLINDQPTYIQSALNDIRTFAKLLNTNGVCMSGHIHLRSEQMYKQKRLIFVGSPLELDFGETSDTHGVYIIDGNNIYFEELSNIPAHVILKISDCFDETGNLKNDIFEKYSNKIVKKIIDIQLSAEQQTKLNDKLSSINIYDFVEHEICYQTYTADKLEHVLADKLTIDNYIDVVFSTLSDDVFKAASTTAENLKKIFNTYLEKIKI